MTDTRPEPTRRVRVDALRTEVRARAALDQNAVDEYADAVTAGVRFPPVVVFEERGTLWLADGHHRVEASRRAERRVIHAEVHAGGRREALLHACGANAAHGVRRTNADKRRAVTLMLNDLEWREWSNREIAHRCAVDEGLVRNVRDELSADDPQIAPAERRVCRGDLCTVSAPPAAQSSRTKMSPRLGPIFGMARRLPTSTASTSRSSARSGAMRSTKTPVLPPQLKGFGALRTAWSAAGAAAREEFLRWLWSEHPEMIGAVMTEPRVTERQSAV